MSSKSNESGQSGQSGKSPTFRDFNPTGDDRVDEIKGIADELIGLVKEYTAAGGAETQRRAAIAVTNLEAGAMWAVKSLFSADAVKGDDGGAKGPDRTEHPEPSGDSDP